MDGLKITLSRDPKNLENRPKHSGINEPRWRQGVYSGLMEAIVLESCHLNNMRIESSAALDADLERASAVRTALQVHSDAVLTALRAVCCRSGFKTYGARS